MPSIQVIIPTYNSASFIGETLESVMAQDVAELEILVLDNCSTDETPSLVSSYRNRGVKYTRNDTNIGAIGNHNRALELATGDYVKLLSSDDVLIPGVLAKQVAALDRLPHVAIATCNCSVTNIELQALHDEIYLPGFQPGPRAIAQCARRVANLLGAPSNTLLRRSMVGTARFNPALKWMADLDFLCQILQSHDYFNIDQVGFFYRRHDTTDSALSCPEPVRLHDEAFFANKYGGGLLAQARIRYRLVRDRIYARVASSQRVQA